MPLIDIKIFLEKAFTQFEGTFQWGTSSFLRMMTTSSSPLIAVLLGIIVIFLLLSSSWEWFRKRRFENFFSERENNCGCCHYCCGCCYHCCCCCCWWFDVYVATKSNKNKTYQELGALIATSTNDKRILVCSNLKLQPNIILQQIKLKDTFSFQINSWMKCFKRFTKKVIAAQGSSTFHSNLWSIYRAPLTSLSLTSYIPFLDQSWSVALGF